MFRKIHTFFILFFFVFATFIPQQVLNAETVQISPKSTQKKDFTLDSNQNQEIIEGEIIVKYKKDKINLKKSAGRQKAKNSENKKGLEKLDEVEDLNLRLVKTPRNTNDVIQELLNDPSVEFAEPNFKRRPMAIPNDTEYANQWALPKISAPEAWDLETADQQDVIVAVIDTGVDYTHPDLMANMWDGGTCVNENNVSIPGGCPKHGWNFADENNDPFDTDMEADPDYDNHGTFVAGLIAGTANNSKGISGTSFHNNIKIMALKFGFTTFQSADAISFAKNNGARVINASYGGPNFSQTEKNAIDAFPGIFVAAAGNDGLNNDNPSNSLYPASYTSQNIISVASTNSSDILSTFSNYGATSVDLSAPGSNVRSTDLDSSTFFNEIFDSTSTPLIPASFLNPSGQWLTASWPSSSDKYISPGSSYTANTNVELFSTTPIDTSSSEKLYLHFYFEGNIEEVSICSADYFGIYTDNNNDNWVQQKIYCGLFSGQTISLDITNSKSSQMRIKMLWHTNGTDILQNFNGHIPSLPKIDDVLLEKFDLNNDIYRYGSGTSFASPIVAGAVAMVFSKKPALSSSEAKNIILNSVDTLSSLSGKSVSGGRLNLKKALESAISAIPTTPIYRLYNTVTGVHLYTRGETDRDYILNKYKDFEFTDGVPAFYASLTTQAGLTPIYRLYNTRTGVHLYTRGDADKNYVLNKYPEFEFTDGVPAFYASLTTQPGLTPIHRLYNTRTGVHLYTRGDADKNYVLNKYPEFEFTDGVPAFYASISQS